MEDFRAQMGVGQVELGKVMDDMAFVIPGCAWEAVCGEEDWRAARVYGGDEDGGDRGSVSAFFFFACPVRLNDLLQKGQVKKWNE